MAEIVVKFNTKTKELGVSMDGNPIDNVMSIHLSKSYSYSESDNAEEFGCSITTLDKASKDDGYQTYTQIIASETSEGKKAVSAGAHNHPQFKDFVINKVESPVRSIVKRMLKSIR